MSVGQKGKMGWSDETIGGGGGGEKEKSPLLSDGVGRVGGGKEKKAIDPTKEERGGEFETGETLHRISRVCTKKKTISEKSPNKKRHIIFGQIRSRNKSLVFVTPNVWGSFRH